MFKFDPVEYLSRQRGRCVKLSASTSRVPPRKDAPADDRLFRVHSLRELEHRAVIIHIDGDLFTRLGMQHRECGTHRDGVIAFTPCTEERADDALLGICAA